MDKFTMSAEGGLGALLLKVGLIKTFYLGAALIGAGVMAAFRPPETRLQLFYHGAVALGASFLFGSTIVEYLNHTYEWVRLAMVTKEQIINFNITVHGLIGALSWGIFGGVSTAMDKFSIDPIKTVKEIKDAFLR